MPGETAGRRETIGRIIVRSITRKCQCRSAKDPQRLFNTLFYQSPIGMELYDASGRLLDVNDACLEIFGIEDRAAIRGFHLFTDPNLPEGTRKTLNEKRSVRYEAPFDFEVVRAQQIYPTARSGIIWTDVLITPLCGVMDGSCEGYLVQVQDITERKQALESLEFLNRKLTLVGSVTRHDVLNQLTAIVGYNELLSMMAADPKQMAFLDKIRQATDRIRRQFQFAKDYQNIGVDSPRWQKIGGLVRLAEEEAGIRSIRMDAASENAEIFADPLIERVFYNLFDNASRHGERVTEIHVSILVSGGTPALVIEDNGIGIPAEEKEKIFERGYGKNTGWGLFLAREILAITGSSIIENGAAGSGARFEIRIPASSLRTAGPGA